AELSHFPTGGRADRVAGRPGRSAVCRERDCCRVLRQRGDFVETFRRRPAEPDGCAASLSVTAVSAPPGPPRDYDDHGDRDGENDLLRFHPPRFRSGTWCSRKASLLRLRSGFDTVTAASPAPPAPARL